jgi:hypothetical protein
LVHFVRFGCTIQTDEVGNVYHCTIANVTNRKNPQPRMTEQQSAAMS